VLAKFSPTARELSGDPTPGGIIAGFISHAEAVFPVVETLARFGSTAIYTLCIMNACR
jgi:hypothetical protein